MKPLGERLVLARTVRSKSQKDVARWLDVTVQAVSQMERGVLDYSKHVETISVESDLHPDFFYLPIDSDVDPNCLSFRSKKSLTAKIRGEISARATIALNFEELLVDRPRSTWLSDISSETTDPIKAAQLARFYLGYYYEPVYDLNHKLENSGISIFSYLEKTEVTAGVSLWAENRPLILLNWISRSMQRDNWTLAHELGHLILHANSNAQELQDEERETEANKFAQEFLLPEEAIQTELPKFCVLEQYLRLKPVWNTSLQALIKRSFVLGHINRWQYEDAFKRINMRGWRRVEPLDSEPVESLFLYSLFESKREQGRDIVLESRQKLGIEPDLLDEVTVVSKYFHNYNLDMPKF